MKRLHTSQLEKVTMPTFFSNDVALVLLIVAMTEIKLFIVDFLLQTRLTRYKASNTGWIGPLTAHAALHGLLLSILFLPLIGGLALLFGLLDAIFNFIFQSHYVLVFHESKLRLVRRLLPPTHDEDYWNLYAFDRIVHSIWYFIIISFIVALLSDSGSEFMNR